MEFDFMYGVQQPMRCLEGGENGGDTEALQTGESAISAESGLNVDLVENRCPFQRGSLSLHAVRQNPASGTVMRGLAQEGEIPLQ